MKVQVWLSIALLPYFLSKFCILSTGIPFSSFLSSIEFHCLSLPEKGNFEGDAKRTMNKRKRFKRSLQETCTATNLYIPNARKNIFWRKGIKDTLKRDKKRLNFYKFLFWNSWLRRQRSKGKFKQKSLSETVVCLLKYSGLVFLRFVSSSFWFYRKNATELPRVVRAKDL